MASSLSMKFLAGLGIDEEKAELIGERHKEVLKEILSERDRFKEDAERIPDLQRQLKEYKELSEKSEKDPYKVKYDALKEEFEDYKNGIAAKETAAKKKDAYRQMLRECGIAEKRIEAVLKVSDFESLEFGEDGKVKDSDKLINDIKTEWAEFITTEQQRGANVPNPPANNPSDKPLTREEIVKIKDTAERQKAWQEFLDNERKK